MRCCQILHKKHSLATEARRTRNHPRVGNTSASAQNVGTNRIQHHRCRVYKWKSSRPERLNPDAFGRDRRKKASLEGKHAASVERSALAGLCGALARGMSPTRRHRCLFILVTSRLDGVTSGPVQFFFQIESTRYRTVYSTASDVLGLAFPLK